MSDEITDQTDTTITTDTSDHDGQTNTLTKDWFEPFAGENQDRREMLSKFDSFDSFFDDYNKKSDWRGVIAGDDLKFKSTLERYADPQAFGNAHREAVQKIRSGQLLPTIPENATDEQIKEFRTQNNIPLEVDGYLDNLPDGMVVGEEDKDLLMDFLGVAQEANVPADFGPKVVEWVNNFNENQQKAIVELDTQQQREATQALNEAWGKDFTQNMNLIESTLSTYFGERAAEQMMNGRYGDGTGFYNDPDVMRGFANMARALNDVAPLVAQDPQAMHSLDAQIEELENYMKNERSKYMKDEKAQTELRELYEKRLKANRAQGGSKVA